MSPTALTLEDVMTPSPATISIDATLSEAKAQMEALQVNHLPVLDGSIVESIISDSDIKRFTLPAHKISQDEELLVKDIIATKAFAADIHDPLDRVLSMMVDRHTNAVIVLKEGELAGIFTATDACKVLAKQLAQ